MITWTIFKTASKHLTSNRLSLWRAAPGSDHTNRSQFLCGGVFPFRGPLLWKNSTWQIVTQDEKEYGDEDEDEEVKGFGKVWLLFQGNQRFLILNFWKTVFFETNFIWLKISSMFELFNVSLCCVCPQLMLSVTRKKKRKNKNRCIYQTSKITCLQTHLLPSTTNNTDTLFRRSSLTSGLLF